MKALDSDDLRAIVTDPSELAKGARVLEDGGLANLARVGDRLFADALGMMASPYKVMVTIGDKIAARCTCMAARTRPFCKHAAALLVAWSRAPEAFAEAEAPPPEERARRRAPKKGKVDDAALMAEGAARAIALVRDLATTGVASLGEGRAAAVHGLAEGLRAGKLRRLAGRVHRLASLLERGRVPAEEYAELLVDILLTARRIEKHVAGEALEPRHVEELIGKTWRKADRAPVAWLDLVEYAAHAETTPDGFVVREQRFVDARTAQHYADKQIVPAFLARRTPAKPSLAGKVARGAAGSLYPGYAPRRIDLEHRGDVVDLDDAALDALVAAALPGAAAALAAFQEHRKDLFAPDALPVTVRIAAIVAGGRLRAADADGTALHLPDDPLVEDQLAAALRGAAPRAIVGDLVLDRALPVLVPRALITDAGLATVTPSTEIRPPTRRGKPRAAIDVDAGDWAAQARAAGASAAAVQLAEVRGEIADLLAQGIASFSPRATEPLAARLRELGLARPAQLLAELGGLDDVVRVHQVLGVALLRVVGTTTIDRDALVAVPGSPGLRVPRPPAPLPLDEALAARARGAIDRFTALVHAGAALEAIAPARLVAEVYPWWAHAALGPLVAAAVAGEPGAADAARRVLGDPRAGRIARQTAVRVLAAADPAGAGPAVAQVLGRAADPALKSFALDLLDPPSRRQRRLIATDVIRTLQHAGGAEDRARAAAALGDLADDVGAAALRRAWSTDPSDDVREAAAIALGRRGDPDAIDGFVGVLARRGSDRAGRAAALGLGQAGDVRGAAALVDALAAGWRPALVADCVRRCGAAARAAIDAALAADPALRRRKTFKELAA